VTDRTEIVESHLVEATMPIPGWAGLAWTTARAAFTNPDVEMIRVRVIDLYRAFWETFPDATGDFMLDWLAILEDYE
jgi:hypothetical protein